jgi:hypothetical protein
VSFKKRKLLNPTGKIIFVLSYILFISLFDSYCYGIVYQQKIKKENYSNSVWTHVFRETGTGANAEDTSVPTYRIIQKSVELLGLIIVFYLCGFWCTLGLLISHYLLTYDLLYYLILNQTYYFHNFQQLYSPYWLQNWYQVGYFVLQPFNSMMFYVCGISGIVIAVGLCFVNQGNNELPRSRNHFIINFRKHLNHF